MAVVQRMSPSDIVQVMRTHGLIPCLAAHAGLAPEDADTKLVTIASVQTSDRMANLLQQVSDAEESTISMSLKEEQRKNPKIMELIWYLEDGTLPTDDKQCHKVVVQST